MRDVIIFDLDRTLADTTHRLNLLPLGNYCETSVWKTFNMACIDDEPIRDNIALCNALNRNYAVVILTGRSDDVEKETRRWLERHGVQFYQLVMRSKYDNRKDIVIKEEVLRGIGLSRILCAFDDSPSVVSHFRTLGLTVHQVCGDTECISSKSWGV